MRHFTLCVWEKSENVGIFLSFCRKLPPCEVASVEVLFDFVRPPACSIMPTMVNPGTIPAKEMENDGNVEVEEDGNEHALRYVIENVDSLCNEYSNAPSSVDGQTATHFDLTTAKILDELEMPTITHAKHEAELLTRLQGSLSRLIEHSREKLRKPRMVERLQSFQEELQKLLNSSPTGGAGRSPRRKVRFNRSITDTSGVLMAEREETPMLEAMKTDRANDRSERVTELDAKAFRKLAKDFANAEKKVIGSSTDSSMATKTPSPVAFRSKPEERSQAIWSSEDTIVAGSIEDEDKAVDDGVAKPQPKASSMKKDIPKKQLLHDTPARSVPFSANAIQANESSIIERRVVSPRLRETDGNSFWTLVLIGLGVVVVFALALGGALGQNIRLTVWQSSCTVANTFCENYGVMCTRYCASGMLREKWQRTHS